MMPAEIIELPVKKRRGRPRGSKNKAKQTPPMKDGALNARAFCHDTIDEISRKGKLYMLVPLIVWAKNNL